MATVSFDKKISIKDEKAMNVLIKGLSEKKKTPRQKPRRKYRYSFGDDSCFFAL